MSLLTSYHDDADDEYTSPHLNTDSEASPIDSEAPSAELTPTFVDHIIDDTALPDTAITEWTAQDCANFLASLNLRQYRDIFLGRLRLFREPQLMEKWLTVSITG